MIVDTWQDEATDSYLFLCLKRKHGSRSRSISRYLPHYADGSVLSAKVLGLAIEVLKMKVKFRSTKRLSSWAFVFFKAKVIPLNLVVTLKKLLKWYFTFPCCSYENTNIVSVRHKEIIKTKQLKIAKNPSISFESRRWTIWPTDSAVLFGMTSRYFSFQSVTW